MSETLDSAWTRAKWIGRPIDETREVNPTAADDERSAIARSLWPPTYLRREFTLEQPAGSAVVRTSALGVYRLYINGTRVGDHELAPGWTDYHLRVHSQDFDVTDLLRPGQNAIGVVVADGWYAGYVGFDRGHQARLWGEAPRGRLALLIDDAHEILTDESWARGEGAIRSADLQMGEVHEPSREPVGWKLPRFDEDGWERVAADAEVDPVVLASPSPPMRVVERLPARSLTWRGPQRAILDFGQNLTGVVSLSLRGQTRGSQIHVRHAEVLDDAGEPYFENLRTAEAHDVVICDGTDVVFEPEFTFHGFRYAEVSGLAPGSLEVGDAEALVIHSDVARLGRFESSDARVDRLYENAVWTVRGNLLDVPTDCPQRDERLGWLGDAGLIMPTAAFALDLDGFLEKWLADVRDAQRPSGAYPDVAPLANLRVDGAPGWADAGALIPWFAYLATGSLRHLEQNYASMERWMKYVLDGNPSLVRSQRLNRNYGDWLNLDDPTPKDLLATAYFAWDAEVLSRSASALGRHDDAERYADLWRGIRDAFALAYIDADGRLLGDTQTGYAMALHLDLVPPHLRAPTASRFVERLERSGHLTTGIHGTKFLAPALSDIGRSDLAYRLLVADGYPSWLHAVDRGATTIWERWDGWTTEHGFQDPRMNSFNHYALGSVAEWLNTYVAGVRTDPRRPGYEHVMVRPYPSSGPEPALRHAGITRLLRGGELRVRWELASGRLSLDVDLPSGSSATVHVPTTDASDVRSPDSALHLGTDGAWSGFAVGPGRHRFDAPFAWDWTPTPTTREGLAP